MRWFITAVVAAGLTLGGCWWAGFFDGLQPGPKNDTKEQVKPKAELGGPLFEPSLAEPLAYAGAQAVLRHETVAYQKSR